MNSLTYADLVAVISFHASLTSSQATALLSETLDVHSGFALASAGVACSVTNVIIIFVLKLTQTKGN